MGGKILNILLIEDNPDFARLVQQWLSGTGDDVALVLNWTDSLIAGLARLAQGGIDVVLLDLSLPDSDGLETFLAARRHALGVPVIILSAGDSESLALQTIQLGAEDYVVKSTCNRELLVRALRYALLRCQLRAGKASANVSEKARVIGVLGAKGGVGTTTIACNLATALTHQTGKDVLLADLDPHSGLISFLMNFDPQYSIVDAMNNVERLDRACWETIVAHRGMNLQVIASSGLLPSDEPATEALKTVLDTIRPFYQWIVMDLGRLNGHWQSLADGIDEVFVVTATTLSSLHEAKRTIDAMVHGGMDRERLRLVVNQTENVQLLSGSELKQIFGIRVYATLPNATEELHQACLERRLLAETGPFGGEMVNLARKVAGLKEKKVKGSLPEFLSFVERFRKSSHAAGLVKVDDIAVMNKCIQPH